MSLTKLLGQVGIRSGLLYNKKTERSYEQLVDAMKAEADCGCGIDCCSGELVLPDKTTGKATGFYVDNGVLKFRDGAGTVYTVGITED